MSNWYEVVNNLYCGDCSKLLAELPDECVDLTVTSPPYDNLRNYEGYTFPFKEIAKQLYRVTKPGGVVVWVVDDQTINGSESLTSFKQALYFKEECGFRMHDTMFYCKNGFSKPGNVRYHQCVEYMFVLSKGKPKSFNPIKDRPNKGAGSGVKKYPRRAPDGTMSYKDNTDGGKNPKGAIIPDFGMRYNYWFLKTAIQEKVPKEVRHPAMFSEQLAHDHIVSWSNEGDLVLDPMCGSGTTPKMAKVLGRNYIGFDMSQEYLDLAKKRIGEVE